MDSVLSYPIVVSQLSFNFLSLLLLYSIYLCGLTSPLDHLRPSVLCDL